MVGRAGTRRTRRNKKDAQEQEGRAGTRRTRRNKKDEHKVRPYGVQIVETKLVFVFVFVFVSHGTHGNRATRLTNI